MGDSLLWPRPHPHAAVLKEKGPGNSGTSCCARGLFVQMESFERMFDALYDPIDIGEIAFEATD